jgi:hypothetical protein
LKLRMQKPLACNRAWCACRARCVPSWRVRDWFDGSKLHGLPHCAWPAGRRQVGRGKLCTHWRVHRRAAQPGIEHEPGAARPGSRLALMSLCASQAKCRKPCSFSGMKEWSCGRAGTRLAEGPALREQCAVWIEPLRGPSPVKGKCR